MAFNQINIKRIMEQLKK